MSGSRTSGPVPGQQLRVGRHRVDVAPGVPRRPRVRGVAGAVPLAAVAIRTAGARPVAPAGSDFGAYGVSRRSMICAPRDGRRRLGRRRHRVVTLVLRRVIEKGSSAPQYAAGPGLSPSRRTSAGRAGCRRRSAPRGPGTTGPPSRRAAVTRLAGDVSAAASGASTSSSSCRHRTIRASTRPTAGRTVAAQALNSSAAAPWTTALRVNRPRAAAAARSRLGRRRPAARRPRRGTRRPPYVVTAPAGATRLVGRAAGRPSPPGRTRPSRAGPRPAAPEVWPYIAASTATLAVGRSTRSRAATARRGRLGRRPRQRRVAGDGGQHPRLDLAEVGAHQHVARLGRRPRCAARPAGCAARPGRSSARRRRRWPATRPRRRPSAPTWRSSQA